MIYFKKDIFQQTNNILSLSEHFKEASDLVNISNAIFGVRFCGMQEYAVELDAKLRRDYPIIGEMLTIADNMLIVKNSGGKTLTNNEDPIIVQRLIQDYFGICTKVLRKEKVINEIKDFIDRVEE